ncbi:MAG TPA: lasso peptide biosynthesis B2 protein [Gemmatimonadaceae bacterium]|nr:lasso peptide biosynthesis B2 protein [Gemmatimonadaceae bacterium]
MTRRDQAEIVLACALLPLALELFPATRVLGWLRRVPRRASASPPDASLARGTDRVLHAAPGPWRYSCLRRAVVLTALLRRAGRDAHVVLGVRRAAAGGFEAHAWIRCEGTEPYLEPGPVDGFQELRPAAP